MNEQTVAYSVFLPKELHTDTANLVLRFAEALGQKLRKAEKKYGYGASWQDITQTDCKEALLEHVKKGDPRDVAAYCAFMWHHDWKTSMTVEWDIVP